MNSTKPVVVDRALLLAWLKQTYPISKNLKEVVGLILSSFPDRGQEDLMEAMSRHAKTTRVQHGGSLAGSWPPGVADMQLQLEEIDEEKLRDRRAAGIVPVPDSNTKIVPLTGHLFRYFKRDFLEVQVPKGPVCKACAGSGWVPFYYARNDTSNVLLNADWQALHEEHGEEISYLYRCHRATCHCTLGKDLHDRFPHSPNITRIMALVQVREMGS